MTQTKSKKDVKKKKFTLKMPQGTDMPVMLAILFLMVFGIIMVASASMGLSVGNSRYLLITTAKQVIFVAAGYCVMTTLANRFTLHYLRSRQFSSLVLITLFSLFACLAFPAVGGAKAWVRIPLGITEITLQPSEFAKIVAILIVAAYTGDISKRFPSAWEMLKKPVCFILIFVGIVLVLQSDFGSAAVIFLISCVCFLIPNHIQMRGFQRFLIVAFWSVLIFAVFLLSPYGESFIRTLPFLKEYQVNRFLSAIDPFSDQYNTGYQLINGLISFASGGWFGVGFGNSVRKYTDFPAANTDFILAIVVEELGFVGFLALLTAYGVIIFRLLSYAMKMKSEKGRIVLVGTAMYLLFHIVFNIGGVTGLIPLTGIPLLMVSAGGSSTMSFMACVGLSQAVIAAFRRGEIQ